MLPSDPDYVPACEDPRILAMPAYQIFLQMNTDPYAPHSRDESLIQLLEEYAK